MIDQRSLIWKVLKEERYRIIVLDACRFDFFSIYYSDFLDGRLIPAYSPASNTPEWVSRVFCGKYDLKYISPNPFIGLCSTPATRTFLGEYKPKEHFEIVPVYDFGWDPILRTVPANEVCEAAISNEYPRMVIHFMQPHAPYIGEKKLLCVEGECLDMVKEGKITLDDVREAYASNLKYVLKHVSKLLDRIGHENTYITADHGELISRSFIGHPPDRNDLELRLIPWFIVK